MSCPIPSAVLKRRSGEPVRYRWHHWSAWGPMDADPKHRCYAGYQCLYQVTYRRRDLRNRPWYQSYLIWHDQRLGGSDGTWDRWTVFNILPERLRHLYYPKTAAKWRGMDE